MKGISEQEYFAAREDAQQDITEAMKTAKECLDRALCLVDPGADDFDKLVKASNALCLFAIAKLLDERLVD